MLNVGNENHVYYVDRSWLQRYWRQLARSESPGLHFHDLRHTGNTLAAATGTSLRDLMARMGHDSPAAALIYQHATSRADQKIAKALGDAMAAGDDQVEAAGRA